MALSTMLSRSVLVHRRVHVLRVLLPVLLAVRLLDLVLGNII